MRGYVQQHRLMATPCKAQQSQSWSDCTNLHGPYPEKLASALLIVQVRCACHATQAAAVGLHQGAIATFVLQQVRS